MTNDKLPDVYDLIIIGSGIAGLSAAHYAKAAGKSVLMLDKGRRIGGRCSTKRADGVTFNHGAQFFTCKDPDFRALTDQAQTDGAVQIWDFGHHTTSFGGAPTMRDFPAFLQRLNALEVRQSVKVTTIEKTNNADATYQLHDEDGATYHCQTLIVTAPAPQAAVLVKAVDAFLSETAASASYDPCWTVMLALNEALDDTRPPLRDAGPIGWANYEPSRDNTAYQPALTIQATPQASTDMLSWQADEVIEAMRQAYEAERGLNLSISNSLAHRWLYARVARPADTDKPFISTDKSLALAGDYFGNARLESAFLSGKRAAHALFDA